MGAQQSAQAKSTKLRCTLQSHHEEFLPLRMIGRRLRAAPRRYGDRRALSLDFLLVERRRPRMLAIASQSDSLSHCALPRLIRIHSPGDAKSHWRPLRAPSSASLQIESVPARNVPALPSLSYVGPMCVCVPNGASCLGRRTSTPLRVCACVRVSLCVRACERGARERVRVRACVARVGGA